MKEKLAKLESRQTALPEKLGLDSLDDLDSPPDAKGAAEAAKQYEAKTKRLERQLAEATAARSRPREIQDSLRRATIADALGDTNSSPAMWSRRS